MRLHDDRHIADTLGMDSTTQTEPYVCQRLGKPCHITYEIAEVRSRRSARPEPPHRILAAATCDSTRECGVEDSRGNFLWGGCVHPALRKSEP